MTWTFSATPNHVLHSGFSKPLGREEYVWVASRYSFLLVSQKSKLVMVVKSVFSYLSRNRYNGLQYEELSSLLPAGDEYVAIQAYFGMTEHVIIPGMK